MNLVDEKFILYKTEAEYFSSFNFCKQNLRRICREKLGMSLGHCIDLRILLEAVTLLLTKEWLVRQVADHLGFLDSNYFSRFIKKHTGMSPSELRMAFR